MSHLVTPINAFQQAPFGLVPREHLSAELALNRADHKISVRTQSSQIREPLLASWVARTDTHTLGLNVALRLGPAHCRLSRVGFSASCLCSWRTGPSAIRTRAGLIVVLAVLRRAPPPPSPVRHLRTGMAGSGRSEALCVMEFPFIHVSKRLHTSNRYLLPPRGQYYITLNSSKISFEELCDFCFNMEAQPNHLQ
ncbi:hypothetical protein XENORESO_014584 [Xenotaenia resolanae]|uniref:Uncharacterized protein n=1 Tax=Xenotaenia resolanae TaxID=208358 RepID=A0ABV0X945_9TELE